MTASTAMFSQRNSARAKIWNSNPPSERIPFPDQAILFPDHRGNPDRHLIANGFLAVEICHSNWPARCLIEAAKKNTAQPAARQGKTVKIGDDEND